MTKKIYLMTLKNEQFIAYRKLISKTKARIKKAIKVGKKKTEKENKAWKKAKEKNQANIRKLAINYN